MYTCIYGDDGGGGGSDGHGSGDEYVRCVCARNVRKQTRKNTNVISKRW